MQTLFPAALAKNLKKLEKLEIKFCNELREIVGKEVDAATDVTKTILFQPINWAQLINGLSLGPIVQENASSIPMEEQYLVKHYLPRGRTPDFQVPLLPGTRELTEKKKKMIVFPQVTFFYPEIFSMESPKLKNLCVFKCPKLELFQGARPDSNGEGESSSTSVKRQHLFSGLNDMSILEDISLDWKHISLLKSGQHTEDLKYLKKIHLWFDENEEPTLPLEILEKAHNLQDLTLEAISSLQIFLTHNPKITEHGVLGQLKVLTLIRVSELQCINLEDSWLNTLCEKLVELCVMNCPGLTKIFHSPSTASFSYLKDLYINRCHGLEYLFTSSVAKVLMHLERIIVKRSQSIKEIVAKEQDETNSQGIK
ncbi:rpp4 candidate R5, partial [Trifolium medium]|nr:rpp4 candidate R5 [Trifolium medium]